MTSENKNRSFITALFTLFRRIWRRYLQAFVHYFDFKGRSSRTDFWSFQLVNFMIWILLSFISEQFASISFFYIIEAIYSFLVFIPSILVMVRRFHDVGISGWWVAAPYLIFIIMGILSGYYGAMSSYNGLPNPFDGYPSLTLQLVAVGWAVLNLVITLLKGDDKPNKYGLPAVD